MKIKLKAANAYETAVLKYLEGNASDALVDKINTGSKTLKQCFGYIQSQARKEATNGCAMIEDKVVYGWAVHFFEEDGIEAVAVPARTEQPRKKACKPTVEKKDEEQMSLFALLG